MALKDTKPKVKISKQQYQALLKRIMDRQASPLAPQQSVLASMRGAQLPQMMPGAPPEMSAPMGMPQDIGQGMPLGQPPMQPSAPQPQMPLPDALEASQGMWRGLQGTPGESIWNLIHQNSELAQTHGTAPEDHFHNLMTQHLENPQVLPQGDEREFLDALLQHHQGQAQQQDPNLQAIEQAMMKGMMPNG